MPKLDKVFLCPPSIRQLEGMRARLKAGMFLEHAAALEGIPGKLILSWIKEGRKGKAGFVEFTNMLDNQTAQIAADLITPIYNAATKDGNLAAAQWLYKTRLGQREAWYTEKMLKLEEDMDAAADAAEPMNEEDIAAAEARALANMDNDEREEKVH